MPEAHQTRALAVDLRFDLRNALLPLGENMHILEALQEAVPHAEAIDDTKRLGWISCYLNTHALLIGDYDRAMASGQRAQALAVACEDLALEVTSHLHLGQVYHILGHYQQAIDALKYTVTRLQGEQLWERFGLAGLPAVHARTWLTWCLAEIGAFSDGMACGEDAVRIADAAERPYDQLVAYSGLGRLYLHKGDLPQALSSLEQSLALCQEASIPLFFPTVAASLGVAYAQCGRVAEALWLLQQAGEQAASLQVTVADTRLLTAFCEVYLQAGRVEEARANALQALELARARNGRGREAYARWLLSESLAHDAITASQPAVHAYRQAIALARSSSRDSATTC